ncbi:hypothetical protein HNY73_012049 [Argiope bruennichi]|uniref:Uncharacterized protein n=1 Tax=Argiope bruennichi TaxID=94029 RepID=A0A8T0ETP2_ARGBR|nr:hypothetical protein HNY73_012049 [Argiope bruennichi]
MSQNNKGKRPLIKIEHSALLVLFVAQELMDYLLTVATSPLSTESKNFFSSWLSWPWARCWGRRGTCSGITPSSPSSSSVRWAIVQGPTSVTPAEEGKAYKILNSETTVLK